MSDKNKVQKSPFPIDNEKTEEIDSEYFLHMLTMIADFGLGPLQDAPSLRYAEINPKSYQHILDAVVVVCKIGGSLEKGIERLKEDYPDNINAYNSCGYGKHSVGRKRISTGEKKAILLLVEEERPNYKNKEETCISLGIEFDTYKKYRASINKLDKQYNEKLKEEGFSEEIISNRSELMNYGSLVSYKSQLENKAFSGIPDYPIEYFGDINDLAKVKETMSRFNKHLKKLDEIEEFVLTPLECKLKKIINKFYNEYWEKEMPKIEAIIKEGNN